MPVWAERVSQRNDAFQYKKERAEEKGENGKEGEDQHLNDTKNGIIITIKGTLHRVCLP